MKTRTKSKYRGEVLIEGKVEKYYVWARSEAQATLLIARQFNKAHKRDVNAFVANMRVFLLKRS